MNEFNENKDGVHLMFALNSEYSLCGCAFDAGFTGDNDSGDLVPTNKKVVTCVECIKVIDSCRAVKTSRAT